MLEELVEQAKIASDPITGKYKVNRQKIEGLC